MKFNPTSFPWPFSLFGGGVRKDHGNVVELNPETKDDDRELKGGEIQDTKTLNLSRNIVSLQVLGRRFAFFINLSRNKNICCGLKKVVAKSRARVYVEQQILPLLLVFHQTYNVSRNRFSHVARKVEGFCISYFSAISKPRRRWQRGHSQTKGLINKQIAVHVRYKSLYISLPSSAKQEREMTKLCAV